MLQVSLTIEEAATRLAEAEKQLEVATEENKALLEQNICFLRGYIQGYCDSRGLSTTNYLN